MGLRGPKPQPTRLQLLRGDPGKRAKRQAAVEPTPEIASPSCPTWLAAEAKREWRRIAPELETLKILSRIDRAALAAYCQCWARWYQAETAIEKHGFTFATESGYLMPRPEVAISKAERGLLKGFLVEFGLSPSSRSRVRTAPATEKADKTRDFLFPRKKRGA